MKTRQRSLLRSVTLEGVALHTGGQARLCLHPAPPDSGVIFRRVDLPGRPEIRPGAGSVTDAARATTLTQGAVTLHTVEHVLSAAHGLGVDNLLVELDGPEPPILDGSARPLVRALEEAGVAEQDAPRHWLTLAQPVSVEQGASSLVALPYDGLRITCTSTDERHSHLQHLSIDLTPAVYAAEVAPARTFVHHDDLEALRRAGKIRGGSLDCAIVIRDGQFLSNEPLRFPDELVRHKILDLVGDLLLLGRPLRAHIIAVRPGHAINCALARQILASAAMEPPAQPPAAPATDTLAEAKNLDIQKVLQLLPHRYPFVLIDRVVEFRGDQELVALKNVTINEPYFQGHFPAAPVMPGVLQVEAMAQAAGILMFRATGVRSKLALFMSADRVKFRKAVRPGDQILIEVKLLKNRGNKIGIAEAVCRVDGQLVSSAELMFTLVESLDGA